MENSSPIFVVRNISFTCSDDRILDDTGYRHIIVANVVISDIDKWYVSQTLMKHAPHAFNNADPLPYTNRSNQIC